MANPSVPAWVNAASLPEDSPRVAPVDDAGGNAADLFSFGMDPVMLMCRSDLRRTTPPDILDCPGSDATPQMLSVEREKTVDGKMYCSNAKVYSGGIEIVGDCNEVFGATCTIRGNGNRIHGYGPTIIGDDNVVTGTSGGAIVQGDNNVSLKFAFFAQSGHNNRVCVPSDREESLQRRRDGRTRRRGEDEAAREDDDRVVRQRVEDSDVVMVSINDAASAFTQAVQASAGSPGPVVATHRGRRRRRGQAFRNRMDGMDASAFESMMTEQLQRSGVEVSNGLLWTRPIGRQGGFTPSHERHLRRQQQNQRQRERSVLSNGLTSIMSSIFGSSAPAASPPSLYITMPGLDMFGSIKDEPVEDGDRACIICETNKPHVVLAPCGHMCMCKECVDTLHAHSVQHNQDVMPRERKPMACPICRENVLAVSPLRTV